MKVYITQSNARKQGPSKGIKCEKHIYKKKFDKKKFLKEYNLEKLNQTELDNLLKKELNKEQLLLIAEKRFGIPRGSALRLSKKQVLDLIESAINNDEILEVIKRKASE